MKLSLSCRMSRHWPLPMTLEEARRLFQCDTDGPACIHCRLLEVEKRAETTEREGVQV